MPFLMPAQLFMQVNGVSGSQLQQQSPFNLNLSRHPSASPLALLSPTNSTQTYTSTSFGPVTPQKLTSFNPSNPVTPVNRSGSSCFQKTPRLEETSDFWGDSAPRSTESFVDFQEFLTFYGTCEPQL